MKKLYQAGWLVGICLTIVLMSGCGGQPDQAIAPAPAGQFELPLPVGLGKHTDGTKLSAELVVDGGAPISLTIVNNRVTGTVGNIESGPHTFKIQYYLGTVLVATVTQIATVIAGQETALNFSVASVNYKDDDNDGFTNIAEIESGTDWREPKSRPQSEFQRISENYTVSDKIGTHPVAGGESKSADYSIIFQ